MANLDLKHLSKIIDLCRKKGLESIEIDGVKLVLGDKPEPRRRRSQHEIEQPIEEQRFSEEATLFWSSGPMEGIS